MAITNLTGTKWLLPDNIDDIVQIDDYFELTFTSNNQNFMMLYFRLGPYIQYGGDEKITVCDNNVWLDNAYKIIEFTGGKDVIDSTLIDNLETYATQILPPVEIEPGFKLTSLEEHENYITLTVNNISYNLSLNAVSNGYSGNIGVISNGIGAIYTKIKFDTPPSSENDYDSYVDYYGTLTGLTSYSNKTKVYVWGSFNNAILINNVPTSGGNDGYQSSVEATLTGNYDIHMVYSSGGAGD